MDSESDSDDIKDEEDIEVRNFLKFLLASDAANMDCPSTCWS